MSTGLSNYLGIQVIRGNQTARAPTMPYCVYNVTTIAGANHGTWQQHSDGIDRKMVKSIFSFSFISFDYDDSVALASKARGWFEHAGHVWLSDRGIVVQSTTDITNRDNILTAEYERKNGFDVVFYVYDAVENPVENVGHINESLTTHEISK